MENRTSTLPISAGYPPPHNPKDRVIIAHLKQWQLLQYPPNDPKLAYLKLRRIIQLQLWLPLEQLSIITPSRLTNNLYEIFPIYDWKKSVASYSEVRTLVESHFKIAPPDQNELEEAIYTWQSEQCFSPNPPNCC